MSKHQSLGKLTEKYPAKQWKSIDVLREYCGHSRHRLLDLGCGTGRAFEQLTQCVTDLQYVGCDIGDSAEVSERTRTDLEFHQFDGINLPFPDESFDIVYSNQVFEHVRFQEDLLQSVHRILKKDGLFVGSLSGLEPYHSRSMFNLTPWGWMVVLNENGFTAETIRPGVDGLTLINRSYNRKLGKEYTDPVIGELNERILSLPISEIEKNRLMLDFAGHIVFVASKT